MEYMLTQYMLTPYMLTQSNLDKWTTPIVVNNNTPITHGCREQERPTVNPVRTQIHHNGSMRDKLFWCFYIIVEGIDQYESAKEKLFKCENEFKYKSVYKIKEKLSELKKLKLKSSELESELVTAKTISMSVLHALAIAYNKSIIYMNDRIYYDFCYGGEEAYFLIEKKNGDTFLHTGDVSNKINKIKETLLCVNSTKSKIINSVSFYTVKDLHAIADRLNIEKTIEDKLLTKALLYNEIVIKIGKLT